MPDPFDPAEFDAPPPADPGADYRVLLDAMRQAGAEGIRQQSAELVQYLLSEFETDPSGIWETNIFGKTVEQLVDDGITTKVASIGEESQLKLQDTMQKIVNDSNGGMVCIII